MISIIIPTYNESAAIEKTLRHLSELTCDEEKEIIIADGGSIDSTIEIACRYATIVKSEKGKAKQLNAGAKQSTGDLLFFVHADMFVPEAALAAILLQIKEGYDGGGFANEFDQHNGKIKLIGRILNLRIINREQSDSCIFYGDNGIFVKKKVFEELGGFTEIPIMEDYDFSVRMKKQFKVKQIKLPKLILSARRHVEAGFFKTRIQWIMIRCKLYKLGVSPFKLAKWYADVR